MLQIFGCSPYGPLKFGPSKVHRSMATPPRASPSLHAGVAEQQARRQLEASERHGAAAACEAEKKERREEDGK